MNNPQRRIGTVLLAAVLGTAGVRAVGMAFAFASGVILARTLGPSAYGLVGTTMGILSIAAIVAEWGLPNFALQTIGASHATEQPTIAVAALEWARIVNIAAAAVVSSLVLLTAWAVPSSANGVVSCLLIGVLAIIAQGQCNIASAASRALLRPVRADLPDVVIRPALFTGLVLVAYCFDRSNLSAHAAMAFHVAATACAAVVAVFLLPSQYRRLRGAAFVDPNSRSWMATAIPLGITQVLHVLLGNIVIVILSIATDATAAGHFRVASSMVLLLGSPITLLNLVAASFVARLHAQGRRDALQHVMSWIAIGMFAGTSILSVSLLLVGSRFIVWIFGVEYLGADDAIRIVCIGLVANSMLGSSVSLMNMAGRQWNVSRAFLVALVVSLAISPVLIREWGAAGAAAASMGGMFVWNVILWLDARSLLNVDSSLFFALRRPMRLAKRYEL